MPTPHTFPDEAQFAAYDAAIAADDGPVVMLNLNRFAAEAAYEDGRDAAGLTGEAAYLRYAVVAVAAIESVGGKVLWQAPTTAPIIGCDHERYDEVIAVWYPSRSAFLRLTDHPGYVEALAHRDAGLDQAAVIPCGGSDVPVLKGPFDA